MKKNVSSKILNMIMISWPFHVSQNGFTKYDLFLDFQITFFNIKYTKYVNKNELFRL